MSHHTCMWSAAKPLLNSGLALSNYNNEIYKIQRLVEENEELLLRSWNEFVKD